MLGKTDLDLLIDRRAVQPLARVLSDTNFKQFSTPAWRSYPGIESYLGMDGDTGTLIHLHLHYRLTVGEKYLKGYRLPWEERLLSTRVFDEAEGVYVADPNLEFLLLIVRAVLKVRTRDVMLAWLARPYLRANVLREFQWLASRIQPERLAELANELLGARAARLLTEMVSDTPPSIYELMRLGRSTEPALRDYRTYSAGGARCRRFLREFLSVVGARAVRRLGAVVPTRLILPHGGMVIAFVGADGAGKSTVVHEISRWLTGLLDVVPIYFGNGQGPASLSRRVLEGVAAVVRRRVKAPPPPLQASGRGTGSSRVRTAGELLWVWSLSQERRKRVGKARRARNRGMVVLCDRYPQSQWVGNDGPCLGHWINDPSWVRRTVARQELIALRGADQLRPDLVVKLTISPEVALRRKPDTPLLQLQTKLRAIEHLWSTGETRVVEIDAARPLDQVLVEVKKAIWSGI